MAMDSKLRAFVRALAAEMLVPAWQIGFRLAGARRTSIGDQVEVVLGQGVIGRRFPAMQIRSEISALLELMAVRQPRVVLEIGTAYGATLWLLSRVAASDALLLSVDLPRPKSLLGGANWRDRVYGAFGRDDQRVRLVRGDSHASPTLQSIRNELGGRRVDFLFIDGDHSYGGVKADWDTYRQLLAPDGVTAFHDIVPGPEDRVGGVPRFWQELRNEVVYREIVDSWSQGGFGIGVVLAGLVRGAERGSE